MFLKKNQETNKGGDIVDSENKEETNKKEKKESEEGVPLKALRRSSIKNWGPGSDWPNPGIISGHEV